MHRRERICDRGIRERLGRKLVSHSLGVKYEAGYLRLRVHPCERHLREACLRLGMTGADVTVRTREPYLNDVLTGCRDFVPQILTKVGATLVDCDCMPHDVHGRIHLSVVEMYSFHCPTNGVDRVPQSEHFNRWAAAVGMTEPIDDRSVIIGMTTHIHLPAEPNELFIPSPDQPYFLNH